jgi:hypothetical protein
LVGKNGHALLVTDLDTMTIMVALVVVPATEQERENTNQMMNKQEFDALEVKPQHEGFYLVTMFQFAKLKTEHPDYIRDWLQFKEEEWDYGGYAGNCYVCFIHARDGI